MSDTAPKQAYRWLTNLYMPFDRVDSDYLAKLEDYKIGAPQVAAARENPLSLDELRDFNIVGIYTTEEAIRRPNPDKITQTAARNALGVDHTPLEGHLAKYLDANCHYIGRQ